MAAIFNHTVQAQSVLNMGIDLKQLRYRKFN